jgi:hypothetical protein
MFHKPLVILSIFLGGLLLFSSVVNLEMKMISNVYSQEQQLNTFENQQLGIQFQYPSHWEKTENRFSELETTNYPVEFQIPTDSITDLIPVSVMVEDLAGKNINNIKEFAREQYSTDLTFTFAPQYTEVLNDQQITIGGKPAWQIDWSIETPKKQREGMHVYLINGNYGYKFSYASDKGEQYLKYLPEFQNLVNSIKFQK